MENITNYIVKRASLITNDRTLHSVKKRCLLGLLNRFLELSKKVDLISFRNEIRKEIDIISKSDLLKVNKDAKIRELQRLIEIY